MRASHPTRLLMVAMLLALVAALGPAARPAMALGGAIVVKSLADTDVNGSDNCTLREALQGISLYRAAPNDSSKATYHECTGIDPALNTITFSVAGTISPSSSLPDISSNIAITGPIIIDGSGNNTSPLFRVSTSDAIFNIANLTIAKGEPGILVLSSSAVVNIAGSSFVGNTAITNGGAIDGTGKINIAGTNFTGNSAPRGSGGAINMGGTDPLNIAGSVFNGNTAKLSGGAISTSAPGSIVDTIFNGNIAQGSDPNGDNANNQFDDYFTVGGGALYNANDGNNDRKMSIIRSAFNGNIAGPYGNAGAMYNASNAVVEVTDSSFNGNLSGSVGQDRLGGAILNANANLSLNRVTLLNNAVTGSGGGIAIDRGNIANLTNVTIIANAATGDGGGIYAFNTQQNGSSTIRADLTVRNATISLNVANGNGGGIYGQAPNNSYPEPHKFVNTILSGNLSANCAGGPFTSQGHNLDSGSSCGFTATGDLQSANADLQAPAFNGGALADLLSQKLGPNSAALEAGDSAVCGADPVGNVDQRGSPRGTDGNGDGIGGCDIGAYEGDALKAGFGSTPVQPGPINFGNVQVGGSGGASLAVFSTGNKPLTLSNPSIQGPNAVDFTIVTAFPITTSGTSSIALTCTPTGSAAGQRVAGLSFSTNDPDHPTVSYDLICNVTPQPVPGYGSNPAAPGPFSFGTALIGQLKTLPLTIFENGNAPLTVNNAQIGGPNPSDFSIGAVNLTLADGAPPANINVFCNATVPGLRSATLTLSTNDPTQPTVTYNLTCAAAAPPNPVLADTSTTSTAGSGVSMNGPYGLALSPDGQSLYVASDLGDSVSMFSRNTSTGALTLQTTNTDLTGKLNGAIRVLVSPDGANVYVAAGGDNRVLAYSRNQTNGQIGLLDSVQEGDGYGCFPAPCNGLIRGLQGAYGMTISPDGKYLYVAGTSNTASTANDNTTIVTFARGSDGSLSRLLFGANYANSISNANLSGTYDLAVSPDGTQLYAINYGASSGSVTVFNRNPSTGALSFVQNLSSAALAGLSGSFRVAFSPDGRFIYISSIGFLVPAKGALVVLQRSALNGTLSHMATYTDGGLDAIGQTIDGLDDPAGATVSADGQYLFVNAYTDNSVAAFERDQQTGTLTFVQVVKRNPQNLGQSGIPALGNARDVVVAPNSRHIYASGYADDRIVFIPFSNPLPTLNSLSPASVLAGAAATTVTLNGKDFVQGVTAYWNGLTPLAVQYVSTDEIRVTLPAPLLVSAGSGTIRAINPLPGGGSSNNLTFTITAPAQNPVPSIDQITPQGVSAGGPSLTLTVSGAGFLSSSLVYWNGAVRPTTYISASTLQAQIGASDVTQPGTSAVTVVNPGPGGGTSNSVGFTVATPGQNPLPAIDHISPNSSVEGQTGGQLPISIYGAGFVQGAKAQWNGVDRPTTFVSGTELRINVNGSDVASAGQSSITVSNPTPGGGDSNAAGFTVVALGQNPLPSLGKATVSAFNQDGTITIALDGYGFVAGVQAHWNGSDRATTLASPTRLLIVVSPADYAAGSAVITATNPAPGGGTSNELLYQLRRLALPLTLH